MEYFVKRDSIVRKIWGRSDSILLIFAGSAAEFALNKAVDWLYYTGKLPSDPMGRLFSTVSYARNIVFSEEFKAIKTIEHMNDIHKHVELKRGSRIPDRAYRDVLFMLIDYSIRAYEILERKLKSYEKEEIFNVFRKVGLYMDIQELPDNFAKWELMRQNQIQNNLQYCTYTKDLFKQYRKHLGPIRYLILLEVQKMIMPGKICAQLGFQRKSVLGPFVLLYKFCRSINIEWVFKDAILPSNYKRQIKELDGLYA